MALTLVGGFIVTPILLRWVGDEVFGSFRVGLDLFGYIGLLDCGISGAVLAMIARAHAREDRRSIEAVTGAGIRSYVPIAAGMLAIGAIAGRFLDSLIPIDPSRLGDLRLGWYLLLAHLVVVPLGPFRQLADARQRSYVVNLSSIPQYLATTGAALALAHAGFGLPGLFASQSLGIIVFNVLLAGYGLWSFPGIFRAILERPSVETRRSLWDLSAPTFISVLCTRASIMTDNIIVSSLLSPTAVVPLIMTQRLASLAFGQLNTMAMSTWAALAELDIRGERALFEARVLEVTRFIGLAGTVALTPIVAFNAEFVRHWVGAEHFANDSVTVVAALNAYVLAIQALWLACFSGTGRIRAILPIQAGTTVLNVALSVALTKPLGVIGPSVGTLCAVGLTVCWYIPRLMERTFGTNAASLIGCAFRPLAWSGPYTLLVCWTARALPPSPLAVTIGEMAVVAVVHSVLCWFVILKPSERADLRRRLGL
jgi:O-antigen/teichoic acid export membrane protein